MYVYPKCSAQVRKQITNSKIDFFLLFSKNGNVGHVSYTVIASIIFLKVLSFLALKQIA